MMMNVDERAGMNNMEKCVVCGHVERNESMYGFNARINEWDINGTYIDFTASVCENCAVECFRYPSRAESEWNDAVSDAVVYLERRLGRESGIFRRMSIRMMDSRDPIYFEISEMAIAAVFNLRKHVAFQNEVARMMNVNDYFQDAMDEALRDDEDEDDENEW